MANTIVSLFLVIFTVVDLYIFISHSDYMLGCLGILSFQFVDPCFELIGNFTIGLLPTLFITYLIAKIAQKRGINWQKIILRTSLFFSAISVLMNILDIRFLWPYLIMSVCIFLTSIFLIFVRRNR